MAPLLAPRRGRDRPRAASPTGRVPGSFTRAALDGWAALGEPVLDEFDDPASVRGAGLIPVNRRGRTRWSAALAYLDPARGRPNLTIVPDALADRVVVEGGRERAVIVRTPTGTSRVEADTIVLAAGAYRSRRSCCAAGWPGRELGALGIDIVADLEGVGRGLVDHPSVHVRLAPADKLVADLAADDARGVLTHVQSKLKAASSRCADGTFDLHLLPNVAGSATSSGRATGRHELSLIPVLLKPPATAPSVSAAPTRPSSRRSTSASSPTRTATTPRCWPRASSWPARSPPPVRWVDAGRPGRARRRCPSRRSRCTTRPAPAGWAGPARADTVVDPTAACRASTGCASRTRRSSRPSRAPTRT